MKVENEYVQIKMGNKTWTHKNMILNEYIKKLFLSQINTIHGQCRIDYCYLKLDEPIENVDYDSEIYPNQFDIRITGVNLDERRFKSTAITNKNYVKLNYIFDYTCNFDIDGVTYRSSILNNYINRKIMGIGFGSYQTQSPLFAYLDTSNMNIVINDSEKFSISRVDILQSDGICKGFDYPLHLVNDVAMRDTKYIEEEVNNEYTKAQLYSVGFGNVEGLMEEEHTLDEYYMDDNSITLDLRRIKKVGHYPSEDLQLGFYPTKDNSKYLIFKYILYRIVNSNVTYLDKYYTMSQKNEDFGDLQVKLKIERS